MQTIKEAYFKLEEWISQNGPKSYDLADIKTTSLYMWIIGLSKKNNFLKKLTAPAIIIAEKYPALLRKLFFIKKQVFAQAQALTARAYLAEYKVTKNETTLNKALALLNWLKDNRSAKFKNYCWGQPYKWYIKKTIPAYTPRATVTSQVAGAFLDAYEITENKDYLEIASSACHFYIEDLNWQEDKDGHICFSYTTEDNYHVHNASMVAAAVLFRTWMHTKIDKFKQYGFKALNFTLKHQNDDGSWYYWAPPDKILGKIDHYHTGFVLEAIAEMKKYLGNEFKHEPELEKGLAYYDKFLFKEKVIPRITNKKVYPIDIQSCAQAIITFGEIQHLSNEYRKRAEEIALWTIEHMMSPQGFFYYRMYKTGRIDKTPYMRWAEAWMLRALSFLLSNEKN